jgi:hypothetical protein
MSVVSDYLGHSSIKLTVKLYGRFSDDAPEKWKWIVTSSLTGAAPAPGPGY